MDINEIIVDLNERMSKYTSSLQPSGDEVRLAACICEIERLKQAIEAERARCLKAVDDESEHIKGSWKPLIAFAKDNIRKRIEADRERPAVQHLVAVASAAMYDQEI